MVRRRPHTRGVVKNLLITRMEVEKVRLRRKTSSFATVNPKGLKTRDNKRTDKFIIKRRNKRGYK